MSAYEGDTFTPEQQEIRERTLEEVLSKLEMKDIMADGLSIRPKRYASPSTEYRMEIRIVVDISRSKAHRIIWGEEQ